MFSRLANNKVPDQYQALALTVEKNLKQLGAKEAAEFQQCSTAAAVCERINPTDQVKELGVTCPDGKLIALFPCTGLGRDCSYCTQSVLSKEDAEQGTARSETQKPA